MIYYFNVLKNPAKTAEILRNSVEKREIIEKLKSEKKGNKDIVDNEFYLKAIYDCTDALYSIKINKWEILNEFDSFLEFIKTNSNENVQLSPIYHLTLGNIYMRKGQYKLENDTPDDNLTNNAITQFEKVPEKPDEALFLLAQNNLGKCYRNLGSNPQKFDTTSLDAARESFENVSKRCKKNLNKYNNLFLNAKKNLGRCYLKMEKFEKAQQQFIEIISNSIEKIGYLNKEEYLNKEKNDFNKKNFYKKFYNEFLEKHDLNFGTADKANEFSLLLESLINLAILKRKSFIYDEAIAILYYVLTKIDSSNIDALNNIASCLRKQKDPKPDTAKIYFNKVLEIDKKNFYAELGIVKCLVERRDCDTALENLERLSLDYRGKKEIMLWKGICYKNKGDNYQAIKLFNEIYYSGDLDKNLVVLKACDCIGECYLGMRKFSEAKTYFQKILEYHPNDIKVLKDFGWCLQLLGEYEKAIEKYKKILENKMPKSDYEKISTKNNLGECYYLTDRFKDAENIFDEVLKIEEDNWHTLIHRGDCLIKWANKIIEIKAKYKKSMTEISKYYKEISSFLNTYEIEKISQINNNYSKTYIDTICDEIIKHRFIDAISSYDSASLYINQNDDMYEHFDSQYILALCLAGENNVEKIIDSKLEDKIKGWLSKPVKYIEMSGSLKLFNYIKEKKDSKLYELYDNIQPAHLDPFYYTCNNIKRNKTYIKYKSKGNGECGKLLGELYQIYDAILKIKNLCRVKNKQKNAYYHYTKLNTLKLLLSKKDPENSPKFRLFNTACMNDPTEGIRFYEILNKISKDKTEFNNYLLNLSDDDNMLSEYSNVYISSLTSNSDDISMFYLYGNYGMGCSIRFDSGFFDLYDSKYQDYYSLYKVYYLNDKLEIIQEENKTKDTESDKLTEALETLVGKINSFDSKLKNIFDNKEDKEEIYNIVKNMFNEIRYLFKGQEYKNEKEYRVMKLSDKPLIDETPKIPRLYIEIDRDIELEEVILGPKVTNGYQIVPWLKETKKVKSIKKSKRNYR
ncbi:tetratricopeptide repeat protein [Thomasclavelia sp.]